MMPPLAHCLLLLTAFATSATAENEVFLWFNKSASVFTDSILIGNGKLGAAVWGNVTNDRFALNEETIWAGGPYTPVNPSASQYLPQARDLVNQGRYLDAQNVLDENCMAVPLRETQYQTAGSLLLNFTDVDNAGVEDYRRELNLSTAITTTTYTYNDVTYTREAFVSSPASLIVVHLTASAPGSLSLNASLRTPMPILSNVAENDSITLDANNTDAENGIPGALSYRAQARLLVSGANATSTSVAGSNGGSADLDVEEHIRIDNADEVTLLVSIASSFTNYTSPASSSPSEKVASVFAALPSLDYAALRSSHIAAHQSLFDRFSVDLGSNSSLSALPTDARVQRGMKDGVDAGLIALFMNFGRYLLIGSSAPGSVQPANLQGIWQHELDTSWESKFTVNINEEMNYWPAETMNLPDSIEPLIRLLEDVAVTGAHTAQVMYNVSAESSGANYPPWVMHHNTDQWRATAPVDHAFYGFWPTGGAWQLQTLWEHYQFDPTNQTFVERVYPLFRGVSQFFLETLQVYPNNTEWLVTNPSLSPEKAHHDSVSIAPGPTLDNTLLRDLFNQTVHFANILGVDSDFAENVTATRSRLPPFLIGAGGQLQEWLEDWDSQPAVFSHISPMYGLFPGSQIDPRLNSTLADAARQFLTFRGDGSFGWPIAWRIGTWARLLDGEHALTEVKLLLSNTGIFGSLMGKNGVFQIDANLGGVGGMTEMFLQSHNGEIHLLPALPEALSSTGNITGLRSRGGVSVDLSWKDGSLDSAGLTAANDVQTVIRLSSGSTTVPLSLSAGQSRTMTQADFT